MSEVLAAPEEGFSVKGATYTIQDDSGELEVIQWLQEGTNQPEFSEGSPVKVIGSIRFDNIFTLKVLTL